MWGEPISMPGTKIENIKFRQRELSVQTSIKYFIFSIKVTIHWEIIKFFSICLHVGCFFKILYQTRQKCLGLQKRTNLGSSVEPIPSYGHMERINLKLLLIKHQQKIYLLIDWFEQMKWVFDIFLQDYMSTIRTILINTVQFTKPTNERSGGWGGGEWVTLTLKRGMSPQLIPLALPEPTPEQSSPLLSFRLWRTIWTPPAVGGVAPVLVYGPLTPLEASDLVRGPFQIDPGWPGKKNPDPEKLLCFRSEFDQLIHTAGKRQLIM